jgi:hypothetical protein
MTHAKKRSRETVLEFALPQDGIGPQLVSWVRGIVRSNNELVPALERLRRSYIVLLAGKPVTDAEEVLWQVEGALIDAEKSKLFSASYSSHEPQGSIVTSLSDPPISSSW